MSINKSQTEIRKKIFICLLVGDLAVMVNKLVMEYYTCYHYPPVRELAGSCETGAATNIIYGMSLGY